MTVSLYDDNCYITFWSWKLQLNTEVPVPVVIHLPPQNLCPSDACLSSSSSSFHHLLGFPAKIRTIPLVYFIPSAPCIRYGTGNKILTRNGAVICNNSPYCVPRREMTDYNMVWNVSGIKYYFTEAYDIKCDFILSHMLLPFYRKLTSEKFISLLLY